MTAGSIDGVIGGLSDACPVRLRPGDDLRDALAQHVRNLQAHAAFVIAGIGSLSSPAVRFAGAAEATCIDGDVEILTLSGSIAPSGGHLHVSLADRAGRVFGGHVAPGCRVRTTAEILLVLLPSWQFTREPDAATGFDELVVRPSAIHR